MDVTSYLLGKKQSGGSSTLIEKNISANNTYKSSDDNAYGYSKVVVNVQPNLETKSVTITENTTTTVTPTSGKDGISSIQITTNVSGAGGRDWSEIGYSSEPQSITDGFNYAKSIYDNWDSSQTSYYSKFKTDKNLVFMPLVNTQNATNFGSMFYGCQRLIYVPQLNTSNGTRFDYMFKGCVGLTSIPQLNTSKATDFSYMFHSCSSLTSVPELNASRVTNLDSMFSYITHQLTFTLGGFTNIGQAYSKATSANYYSYMIPIQNLNLTHDSLMNVINKLYDIATKGCNTQNLSIGSTNLAKLTAEEIAIATNKGWTVS